MRFALRAKLAPAAVFGLPDGEKTVLPIGPGGKTSFATPILDRRTGKIAGYGTLSVYRKPEQAVDYTASVGDIEVRLRDNFVSVHVQSDDAQRAIEVAIDFLDRFCQCLTVQLGQRISVTLESFEDAEGNPHAAYVRKTVPLFSTTIYDIETLKDRLGEAADWAVFADDRSKKALFYCEHAHLLSEFSKTLPVHSPHAAFSLATAFLQMFKALVTVIGEAGVDSDYQRRAKQIGLGTDFWTAKVQPLYKVRNDGDVAHYTLTTPDLGAAYQQFVDAGRVFREALVAYMQTQFTTEQ